MSMDGTPGASDMVNNQEKKYPRIWDRNGERKIIGETKMSWIVCENRRGWTDEIIQAAISSKYKPWWWKCDVELVSKRTPNKNLSHPQWFFTRQDHNDLIYRDANKYKIAREVEFQSGAVLRQIAELIGHKEQE